MLTSIFKKQLFLICVLTLAASVLSAHPHIFLTSTAEFVWDKKQLAGCYLEWTFDKFFSADIIRGYDTNGDGRFDVAETREIYAHAFINLKNYHYFTFIRQGKTRTNPSGVSRFTASLKNGNISYRFFVDLSKTAPGEISLAVYDYTFFCDIAYPDTNAVTLTYNSAYINPSYEIVENRNYPVYYDPLGSMNDTTIYYEWKKGLQIYYPREIRITYAR